MARTERQRGFTLIELMVVVVILGVLAALALPAFTGYLKSTKTSEATTNLNLMFKSASSFYAAERSGKGMQASTSVHCIVESTTISPAVPRNQKSIFTAAGGVKRMGFTISDFVYYGYGMTSVGAAGGYTCGIGPSLDDVYTFYALGDLDSDGIRSTFSLAVGTDAENELFHARGFYVVNLIE